MIELGMTVGDLAIALAGLAVAIVLWLIWGALKHREAMDGAAACVIDGPQAPALANGRGLRSPHAIRRYRGVGLQDTGVCMAHDSCAGTSFRYVDGRWIVAYRIERRG